MLRECESMYVTVVHIPGEIFEDRSHNPYAVTFTISNTRITPLFLTGLRLTTTSLYSARLVPVYRLRRKRSWISWKRILKMKRRGEWFKVLDRKYVGREGSIYTIVVNGREVKCTRRSLGRVLSELRRSGTDPYSVELKTSTRYVGYRYLIEYWIETTVPDKWWYGTIITASKPNGARHRIVKRSIPAEVKAVYEHTAMMCKPPEYLVDEKKEVVTASKILVHYLDLNRLNSLSLSTST